MGCSNHVQTVEYIEKDTRPPFKIDPAQPFRLEFGRGSGWHGLDTIRFDQAGTVILHRIKHKRQGGTTVMSWETATLEIQPAVLAEVLLAVESNGLMELQKAYHADIADGTQWVFWIKQGEREKSVYFNNSFPNPIIRFAEQLDLTLAIAGLNKVVWQPVPPVESRKHERGLWVSIER